MNDEPEANQDGFTEPDPELRRILGLWRAPEVPASLDRRIENSFREQVARVPLWRRMFAVSIPVPLPVAVAIIVLLVFSVSLALRRPPMLIQTASPSQAMLAAGRSDTPVVTHTSLKGFEPVPEMNATVVSEGTRP